MTETVHRGAESSPWSPRESELLAVTLQLLQEHGYDRLTVDAVAAKAHASKATVGIELYWVVLALAVILLLAVGSDYNLLLISRFKEEIGAGLKTGIIRAMAGSGSVVTAAGLVFAVTMCGFVFSGLQVLGQIG